jgi:hypothetical protein
MQMKKPSFCWTFSTDNPLESDDSSGLSLAKNGSWIKHEPGFCHI